MEENIKKLEKTRNKLTTRSFLMAFEIIFIFGIPALLAVVIGKAVSDERIVLYVLLGLAFVLSWFITVWRTKKAAKDIKEIQRKIDELKANQDKDFPK